MNTIKNIPTAISGLALGSVALGNLLEHYNIYFKHLFSLLSLMIVILLSLKFVANYKNLLLEITNPIIATVLSTFAMTIMLLSIYLKNLIGNFSICLWFIGIALDITILLFVFYNFFIKKRNIEFIYPSWFITFVGPAVITVTAKNYNLELLGEIFFWFSFVDYLILLPIVLYRVYFYKKLKAGEMPLITIFSAPGGLLLASYMIGINDKNYNVVVILLTLTTILYLFVLCQLPKLLNRKFTASFSAFTFPLVICGAAFQKTSLYFTNDILNIVHITELLATIIVIYVAINCVIHLYKIK